MVTECLQALLHPLVLALQPDLRALARRRPSGLLFFFRLLVLLCIL